MSVKTEPSSPAAAQCRATLEAVWRLESGRLVGAVMRIVRDLAVAEEVVQDALVRALECWTDDGIPPNPAGWLMTVARNRAMDRLRRQVRFTNVQQQLSHQVEISATLDVENIGIDDDVLRLMFMVCHPLLAPEARVALALRLVNGLTVGAIARAYFASDAAIAQRITRAKRTLKAAGVGFDLPDDAHRGERLQAVLEAVYLIFNAGYAVSGGDGWMHPRLCSEALRFARSLAGLVPDDTEVLGLAALLEFQASRMAARLDAKGAPVPLKDQDKGRWDWLMVRRGNAYLSQAFALGQPVGAYCLQAAIAECHARPGTWDQTPWNDIAALYDALMQAHPTPVVALNRAVAIGMVDGPAMGLELVEDLVNGGELAGYPFLYSVRAELLERVGRYDAARADFLKAADLAGNSQDRSIMQARALACAAPDDRGRLWPPH